MGAAMLGVPAAIGFVGGPIGLAACAVGGAAIGYLCGKHDGKATGYCTVLFGALATIPAALGCFGGPIGVGVGVGLGLLLGLAGDAVNRGTRPGY